MNERHMFRVWSEQHGMYWNPDDIVLTPCGQPLYRDHTVIDPKEHTIEQCTGLKDRNGKLIYEGDVVDYYSPMADEHYQGVVTFDDDEHTASGYYIKGGRVGKFDSYLDGSYCRIIGNIHEVKE
jgi:uncharacterized phage protein (TIGR01671 family)